MATSAWEMPWLGLKHLSEKYKLEYGEGPYQSAHSLRAMVESAMHELVHGIVLFGVPTSSHVIGQVLNRDRYLVMSGEEQNRQEMLTLAVELEALKALRCPIGTRRLFAFAGSEMRYPAPSQTELAAEVTRLRSTPEVQRAAGFCAAFVLDAATEVKLKARGEWDEEYERGPWPEEDDEADGAQSDASQPNGARDDEENADVR